MRFIFIFLLLVTTCLAIPTLPPLPNSGSTILTTTTISTEDGTTTTVQAENQETMTTTTNDALGDEFPELIKEDNKYLYASLAFSFLELLAITFLLYRLKLRYDELERVKNENQALITQQSRAQQNNPQNVQQNYPQRKF